MFDNTTHLPETISGVLSGIVSKRIFGAQGMNISEQKTGYASLVFTPDSYSPSTYLASQRILGISHTKKCELIFSNKTISPVKIDLTAKLAAFNDLTINNTLCMVHIDEKMEVTIKVIDWEERNYEFNI
jgi:hypothetical protein